MVGRIIAVLLSFLFLYAQHSFGRIGVLLPGRSSVTADYCTGKLGSYSFYYDADHPTSTTTACKTGGTSTVTLTASTAGDIAVSSEWNGTSGGTYSVKWNGSADDYITAPSADLGIATDNGRVELDLRVGSTLPTGSIGVFEWGNNPSAAMILVRLQYNATGYTGSTPGYRLLVNHYDGTSDPTSAVTTYVSASSNTTYHVVVDWNGATNKCYGKIITSENLGTAAEITTFTPAGTPDTPKIGERYSSNNSSGDIYFDNILSGASQQ